MSTYGGGAGRMLLCGCCVCCEYYILFRIVLKYLNVVYVCGANFFTRKKAVKIYLDW